MLKGTGRITYTRVWEGKFVMKIGSLDVMKEAIVADLEDEALLGYDVLCDRGKGAADLLLSKNLIVIDGVEVPCFLVGKNSSLDK